jgi:ATP-binding cassette subfamily C (CFTR/MRP) protein 1
VPQEATLFRGTIRSNLDPFHEYDDAQVWAALDKAQLAHTLVTSLDDPVAGA